MKSSVVRGILRRFFFVPYVNMIYGALYFFRRNIRVAKSNDTVDFILSRRCSVSRYGDGEMNMIIQLLTDNKSVISPTFQQYDKRLAERLLEIISAENYDNARHIVCIPLWFRGYVGLYKPEVCYLCKKYFVLNHRYILRVLNRRRQYFNANITRFYMSYVDKAGCEAFVARLKKIWDGRSVCVVEGVYSRLGVGNDLFANAADLKRILCPAHNAFSRYDEILHCIVENIPTNTLVLIALGHTATVLAYDLSLKGFQAIDLGHIDVEYEWMLMGATDKAPLRNKSVNEVGINNVFAKDCADSVYQSQILAEVV